MPMNNAFIAHVCFNIKYASTQYINIITTLNLLGISAPKHENGTATRTKRPIEIR